MSKTLLDLLENVRGSLPKSKVGAMDDIQEAMDIIRAAGLESLGVRYPSHLTVPQVARVLKVSTSAIKDRIKRGTMKVEIHYGARMIPIAHVITAIERKGLLK